MIAGLQVQGEPTQNGKVFYHPAVLTVNGTSKYRDTEITFREISGFWSLPQNYVYSSKPRAEGTNPTDGVLHPSDVAKFTLNLNPKRGENANPGSFYHNIGSIGSPNGEAPIQRQQQDAPRSGGSWASDTGQSDGQPVIDKWDLRDIYIRKAQAENILSSALSIPDEKRMIKVLEEMGFKDFDEANKAHGYGYSLLRRGLPVELPVAVSDMEEEVTELIEDDAAGDWD